MTAKEFFKSTTFKCIITLLCVLLISGVFLTIMNGLLEVTVEEKLSRAISAIYGKSVTVEEQEITNKEIDTTATIEDAYLVTDDGNYLIKSTGKEGFDNGTVTCWVVVKITAGKVSGIDKVKIESNTKQSYIDRVGEKALNQFSELYKDGIVYEPEIITGATVTRSKNAICNAVNGAITFVKVQILKEEIVVPSSPFDSYLYNDKINKDKTELPTADGTNAVFGKIVTKGAGDADPFTISITVNADKAVESFVIVKNGSTDGYEEYMYPVSNYIGWKLEDFLAAMNDKQTAINSSVISTGASYSSYLCIYAGAFATANYDKCFGGEAE